MTEILNNIDSIMYYPILIIVLAAAGLIFSLRTKFIQIRLYPEAWRTLMDKTSEKGAVSSFQALMDLGSTCYVLITSNLHFRYMIFIMQRLHPL